jgi:hypothetical protein
MSGGEHYYDYAAVVQSSNSYSAGVVCVATPTGAAFATVC